VTLVFLNMVENKTNDDTKDVKETTKQTEDSDAGLKKEFEVFMAELK
jgi:hypothetical protein